MTNLDNLAGYLNHKAKANKAMTDKKDAIRMKIARLTIASIRIKERCDSIFLTAYNLDQDLGEPGEIRFEIHPDLLGQAIEKQISELSKQLEPPPIPHPEKQ